MKKSRPKYAVGTAITNYIEDPSTMVQQSNINFAKAKAEAAQDPWVVGLKVAGQLAGQTGGAMGGVSIPGASKAVNSAVNAGLSTLTTTASMFASGGSVGDLDEETLRKLQEIADANGISVEEVISQLQNTQQSSPEDFGATSEDEVGAYASGGTIHINPANKGKFNATKKRTGKTTEELTHSKNPLTRKRAIFAQNAAKWKHADGGEVEPEVPVEVEGEEMGEMPNGQLLDFQGPSHEEGGIDIDLPKGTEIYSKRISIDGKTMAERKRTRENLVSRYTKRADKTGDAIDKNTLDRILFGAQKEEASDRAIQDAIHKALTAKGQTLVGREKHDTNPVVGTGIAPKYSFNGDMSMFDTPEFKTPEVVTPAPTVDNNFDLTPEYMKSKGYVNPLDRFPNDANTDNNVVKKSASVTTPEDTTQGFQFTGGDALNMAGNLFQGIAPYINNLNQRATDTPNINAYKDYGKEGLQKMSETEQFHKQVLDDALLNLESSRRSATTRARNTARGVNTLRALDLAAQENADAQGRSLYDSYASRMASTLAQEAGMENEQDRMVMQGEQARDLADRQDKDAFYTANGELLRNLGMSTAQAGKQVNQALERDAMYNLIDKENFGYDRTTGKIYGKAAQALSLPEGSKPSVYDVQKAWNKGTLQGMFKTLQEAQDYYAGLSMDRPDNLISTTTTTKKSK